MADDQPADEGLSTEEKLDLLRWAFIDVDLFPDVGRSRARQPVVRVDRYTIQVDGHRMRADADQEARIAALTAEERQRLLTIMGARRD